MSSITHAGSYLRPAQTQPSRPTLTRADALSDSGAGVSGASATPKQGIPISEVKKLDTAGLKVISIDDHPELRDRMATMWLNHQAAEARRATEVPDNAPQNIYATVKVNGEIVATLYNGGGSGMTNAAAGAVGDLQDPPGLNGGPALAQARAERIAKVLGGTIEKAPTAITPSQWTPRPDVPTNYSRRQLDDAWQAMTEEGRRATAQRQAGYANAPQPAGINADFSA